MPGKNETALPPKRREILPRLLEVFLALAISVVAAELLWVNRFLRDVIQIRGAFWYYLAFLLVTVWISLSVTFKGSSQSRGEGLTRIVLKGVVAGLLGSLIAISGTPLLEYGSLASTYSVWRKPVYLIYAVILSLGWVYGGLAGLALFLIDRRRYLHIGYLVGACAVIGILERIPILRWIEGGWPTR
jgi:hypothetical protein